MEIIRSRRQSKRPPNQLRRLARTAKSPKITFGIVFLEGQILQRKTLILLIFLASFAFGASARAADAIAEIPYRIDYDGWITVSVMVNGKGPYDFIVDSGATITSTFQNLANDHIFTPADRPPIRILGLVGAEALPAMTIGDVTISSERMDNHVGVVLPDWEAPRRSPDGVLGLDFLTQYTVLFDAEERRIRLYDRKDSIGDLPDGWSKTSMPADDFNSGAGVLYRTAIKMQGHRIQCIVDLGASGTLVNYKALERLLSGVFFNGSRSGRSKSGSRLNDVFDNTYLVRRIRVGTVKLAEAEWRNHVFIVFNAPIFEQLSIDKKPSCLLGADLMMEHSFILDFAREKLYMGPKARRRATDTG